MGVVIPQIFKFKYLGSIIQNDAETTEHATHKSLFIIDPMKQLT